MAGDGNLDRYRHIATLGSGGMATVELAQDTLLGRQVALKRINTPGDRRRLSRLRREALVGASLSHPNLVSIYDVLLADDGDQVIVMEYVPGETLRDALRPGSGLAVSDSLRVLEGIGAALDAIHRRGVVHRDVKPGNILLKVDGTPKLADLGIASVSDRTQITTDGAVLGTFSYMAPEQLGGARSTPAVDVYALSVVGFEMLSGRRARTEPNPLALAHAISSRPPPDLRQAWPRAPAAAAEVLIRGMCRDPAGRPRSASELTRRLRAAFEPETTAPIAAPVMPSPARSSLGRSERSAAQASGAAERHSSPQRRRREDAAAVAVPAGEPIHRRPGVAAAGAAAAAPAAGAGGAAALLESDRRERRPEPEPATEHREAVAHYNQRRWRRALPLAALTGAVVAAVALIVLLQGGGSHSRTTANSAGSRRAAPASAPGSSAAGAHSGATGTGSSAPATGATAGGAGSASSVQVAAPGNASPVQAVETFYGLAASHRYEAAWALADPSFRDQLGGYQSFAAGQDGERSITFNAAHTVSKSSAGATVAVQTTSVRTDGTQHCAGTVNLAPGGAAGGWMLHLIHINCS